MTNHHQVEVGHGDLQDKRTSSETGLGLSLSLGLWVRLTVWWCVVLALQLVKLVQVLLLSGWRPHWPVSVQTLDAVAVDT